MDTSRESVSVDEIRQDTAWILAHPESPLWASYPLPPDKQAEVDAIVDEVSRYGDEIWNRVWDRLHPDEGHGRTVTELDPEPMEHYMREYMRHHNADAQEEVTTWAALVAEFSDGPPEQWEPAQGAGTQEATSWVEAWRNRQQQDARQEQFHGPGFTR